MLEFAIVLVFNILTLLIEHLLEKNEFEFSRKVTIFSSEKNVTKPVEIDEEK